MRPILTIAMLGLLATGLGGCGSSGSSQTDYCNQAVSITCDKMLSCLGATTMATLGYGSTAAECTTNLEAQQCSNPSTMTCPTAGQTFHADKAPACLDAMKALSCTDLLAGTPAACVAVCS
jgi:hypothetical protein